TTSTSAGRGVVPGVLSIVLLPRWAARAAVASRHHAARPGKTKQDLRRLGARWRQPVAGAGADVGGTGPVTQSSIALLNPLCTEWILRNMSTISRASLNFACR